MSKFCYQEVFFSFFLLFTPHPPQVFPSLCFTFSPHFMHIKNFFFLVSFLFSFLLWLAGYY